MNPSYVYRATCEKVIDGDTYDLLVDLGFRTYSKVRVRLHGYDAPELSTERGQQAKDLMEGKLLSMGSVPATQLIVQSYKDVHSFERWVCDVWIGDKHLGEYLRDWGMLK